MIVCVIPLSVFAVLWYCWESTKDDREHARQAKAQLADQIHREREVRQRVEKLGPSHLGEELDYSAQTIWIAEIEFQGTRVNDSSLAELKLEELERIRHIGLVDTSVSNDGLACLASVQQLTSVFLRSTTITDEGLVHLVEMKRLRSIMLLQLPITDTGLSILSKVETLEQLGLYACKGITQTGLDRFRKARPTCKVSSDLVPAGVR